MNTRVAGAIVGVIFGFTLCWSGMSDPAVIRAALLFQDGYLYLMFASALVVAGSGQRLLRRAQARALLTGEPVTCPRERPGRRHIVGSVVFGLGWGVADACPGPIATQVGQGIPWALFTLAGVVASRAARDHGAPTVVRPMLVDVVAQIDRADVYVVGKLARHGSQTSVILTLRPLP